MTGLLEIQGLTKRFGRTEVLRGISLSVPRGAIYGFVGRNGAGKTTTIECALGLLRADGGEIRLLGRPPREICRSGGRIGIALDVPGLHPHLTVREELEHAALFTGREGRTPAQVLALAGIGEFASRKTRKLSLGNRRRAAIALAILGRPELIVLDEPFSGLDPPGVEDLLSLFLRLREGGTTVLFSSHQLELVERVSTHLGLIHEGRMVREGPLGEILVGAAPRLRIRVDSADRALTALGGRRASVSPSPEGGWILELEMDGTGDPAEINAAIVRAGVAVSELRTERCSLSRVFRDVLEGRS